MVCCSPLSDETRDFIQDRYRDFFWDQIFSRPIRDFFSRPNIFETDSETFFSRPKFSRPRPILSKNWEKSRYREVSRRDVTLCLEDDFATRTVQIDLSYFKTIKCFRESDFEDKGGSNLIRRPYSVFLWLFQRANIWWWCPSGPQVTKSYRFLHFITRQTDTHGSSQSTLAQNHIKCALDLKTWPGQRRRSDLLMILLSNALSWSPCPFFKS